MESGKRPGDDESGENDQKRAKLSNGNDSTAIEEVRYLYVIVNSSPITRLTLKTFSAMPSGEKCIFSSSNFQRPSNVFQNPISKNELTNKLCLL
jgi:hypothetical protein